MELSARGYDYMAKSAAEPDRMDRLQDELIQEDAAINDRIKAARGGGKLSRTETVTVRLDPQLNYLCELAARAQRRTKSSFIEWAIENALQSVGIPGEKKSQTDLWTIAERNADLWDVDDPDRMVALVAFAPSLLTHDEQVLWKVIATSPFLWRGNWADDGTGKEDVWSWNPSTPYSIIMDRLRDNWESIKRVADGTEPRDENFALKSRLVRGKSPGSKQALDDFDTDLDDDLPF